MSPRRRASGPRVSTGDAGLDAVEAVRAALAPEPERLVLEARGFRWWPHAHALDVWAEPPRADGASRVVAETPILAHATGSERGTGAEFAALARRNAREPGLSSLRWNGERGEVSLRASVIARPGDGGAAARALAHAALLQVGEALLAADALAVELPAARLLASAPPDGRARAAAEQVEAWRAYAMGAAARARDVEEAVARLRALAPAPWVRVTHAAHGLDAELASEAGHEAAPHAARALLRVSARQPHPRLGAGLVTALVPPAALEPDPARAAATAALLNEGEAREWTGVDALGGWCVHPSAGLTHVSFVPALALEPETAERLAWQAGTRARWAAAFLGHAAASRGDVTGGGSAGAPPRG